MRLLLLVCCGTLCLSTAPVLAQQSFARKGQYAQFRNLSGLPGGGTPVRMDGGPGPGGALAISTPVAYSLAPGRLSLAVANTSYDSRFRFFSEEVRSDFGFLSNGSAAVMMGLDAGIGRVTIGMHVASGGFEDSYSCLITPRQRASRITFAGGAQGLFARGGLLGHGLKSDADRGTSLFAVATADLGEGLYASAGIGTSRFSRGFANVSYGRHNWHATLEHDGFGWNFGVGTELAKIGAIRITALAGFVQSRYAFWALGLSF